MNEVLVILSKQVVGTQLNVSIQMHRIVFKTYLRVFFLYILLIYCDVKLFLFLFSNTYGSLLNYVPTIIKNLCFFSTINHGHHAVSVRHEYFITNTSKRRIERSFSRRLRIQHSILDIHQFTRILNNTYI